MGITAGTAAKVGGAAAFIGAGGTGIYLGYDFINNHISLYEKALIDFLRDDDKNDIIFEVKKGNNGNEDLGENDIEFPSSTSSPVSVKIKVTADPPSTNNFKKGSKTEGASNLDEIKKLGKETNGWIWECSFEFKVEGKDAAGKSIKEDYKKRIWQNSDLGLFGLLKKDITTYTDPTTPSETIWTREDIKRVKRNFIRKCGYYRGINKNKEISGKKADNDEIKVGPIEIEFMVKDGSLVPKYEKTFNYWFLNKKGVAKTYSTNSAG